MHPFQDWGLAHLVQFRLHSRLASPQALGPQRPVTPSSLEGGGQTQPAMARAPADLTIPLSSAEWVPRVSIHVAEVSSAATGRSRRDSGRFWVVFSSVAKTWRLHALSPEVPADEPLPAVLRPPSSGEPGTGLPTEHWIHRSQAKKLALAPCTPQ